MSEIVLGYAIFMCECNSATLTFFIVLQDYESIKVSLESSERIRKQQKELINLLQRSHSIGVAAATGASVGAGAGGIGGKLVHGGMGAGDTASVMSFNSLSTISQKGEGFHSGAGNRFNAEQTPSIILENKEWLVSMQTAL